MKNRNLFAALFAAALLVMLLGRHAAQEQAQPLPRILVSTDIGGTDPDDNQSMAHLLMFSDRFEIEGLVSSPSYGTGSKEEILRMIDLYERDLPRLRERFPDLKSPDALRAVTKQGRRGAAPLCGYDAPTEGSELLVRCARRDDERPLYVLVWGGLEDVAQALHDAPDIAPRIRVYWIGGPNKKWSVNSYLYLVEHHPDLWMIECNASYRGFIADNRDSSRYHTGYYDYAIRGAGALGADFADYYKGTVKMGDTPSLLYMTGADPADPAHGGPGGRFEKLAFSPRTIFRRATTAQDTVALYSVVDWRLEGPVIDRPVGTPVLTAEIDRQTWEGYYLGEGRYTLRYAPKGPASLTYRIRSEIAALDGLEGAFTVCGAWPGVRTAESFPLGGSWWTDCADPALFGGPWHGFRTVADHREAVLEEWAARWNALKE